MKKSNLMMLALMGLTAGISANAQAGQETAAQTNKKDMSCPNMASLSSDEQAFASKLNDKNKKAFCGQFSSDQRRAAMMASCKGPANCGADKATGKKKIMSPDDAVGKVMNDNNMSMAEKRANLTLLASAQPVAQPSTAPAAAQPAAAQPTATPAAQPAAVQPTATPVKLAPAATQPAPAAQPSVDQTSAAPAKATPASAQPSAPHAK